MKATNEAIKRMDIAKRVALAYAELNEVDSLAVGGSTARGNADEFSDIEIWMTYSELPSGKDRKQVIGELDESRHPVLMQKLDDGMTLAESFVVSNVQVGILPGTNDMLLSVGTDIEKCLGESSEKGVADFHDCVILYDPKRIYDVVKNRLNDYPVILGTKVIQRKLRELVKICALDMPRAIKNQNWMQLLESRAIAQELLIRIAFVLNKDYFPRLKDAEWLLQSMTHLPEYFASRMNEYAREYDPVKARQLLIDIIKELLSLTNQVWSEPIGNEIIASVQRLNENLIPVLDYD